MNAKTSEPGENAQTDRGAKGEGAGIAPDLSSSDPRLIDCHTHVGVDQLFYLRGHSPYGLDYRSLLEQAGSHGIGRVLVFPCVSYFGWQGLELLPPSGFDDDFSVPYAFENRRMLSEIYELSADCSGSAIPFAIVDPARFQKKQAASLRRLRERFPICGLKIQATVIEAPIRSLLGEGACLLELAQEWNIPVLIHSSIAASDLWSQTSDILDVAEAWPGVRFCLAHSCRFDVPSLDRVLTLANAWVDCSAHGIHCDAAVSGLDVVAVPGRRLDADYTRPESVLKALFDRIPDRLMWGSDAPFYSFAAAHEGRMLSLSSTYGREVAAMRLLSEAERGAIARENTLRFLSGNAVTKPARMQLAHF